MTCRLHMDVDVGEGVLVCSSLVDDVHICFKDCRYFRDYDEEMSEGAEWK